jgi:hypothetical protein
MEQLTIKSFQEFKGQATRLDCDRERKIQQDPSRYESLAGDEDSFWTRVVVGLALAGIAMWAGFVVS